MIKWGTFGSHDGALAVFQDDELLFASDAERWSREKMILLYLIILSSLQKIIGSTQTKFIFIEITP